MIVVQIDESNSIKCFSGVCTGTRMFSTLGGFGFPTFDAISPDFLIFLLFLGYPPIFPGFFPEFPGFACFIPGFSQLIPGFSRLISGFSRLIPGFSRVFRPTNLCFGEYDSFSRKLSVFRNILFLFDRIPRTLEINQRFAIRQM